MCIRDSVCTHPDGHNHSGNMHVHIVINSLRIEEVPFLPYMDLSLIHILVFTAVQFWMQKRWVNYDA